MSEAPRAGEAGAEPLVPQRVGAYVALGDSFTQGPGCPPERRWADRLATELRLVNPELRFANLAVEGAPSDDVLGQLKLAAEYRADLASVICGANDVLLSVRPDIDRYAANFNRLLDGLAEFNPEVALFTATVPDSWQTLEMRPRTRRRVVENLRAVNQRTREVAAERGLPLIDVARHPQMHNQENFGADGLHPSELGHRRAATEFARLVRDLLATRGAAGGATAGDGAAVPTADAENPSTQKVKEGQHER